MAAGKEPHCYQSPAFDVGPDLTPGQPPATARGAVGCKAFLGAIYVLAGGEESFYCEEGGGERALQQRMGGGCFEEQWREPRHRTAPSCLHLANLPGLGGGLLEEAFSDGSRAGEDHHLPPPTTYMGPHRYSPGGCRQKQLLFPPGSWGPRWSAKEGN